MKKKIMGSMMGLLIAGSVNAADVNEWGNGTLTVRNHTSTSDISILYEGYVVLLKNYSGGYLMDNRGSLATQAIFSDESQIWVVEENQSGYGKMFRNKKTGNYLKIGRSGAGVGLITGSGDAGSFGVQMVMSDSNVVFDYRKGYSLMESYKHSGKCLYADTVNDHTITVGNCSTLNNTWRFEILAEFEEVEEETSTCDSSDGQLTACSDDVLSSDDI